MADSPRIKGWRNVTVENHVSAPVTIRRELFRRRPARLTALGHISVPIISPSNPIVTQRTKRRKVEAVRLIPSQTLIDNYNRRKQATARFPYKITPHHIRTAMRRQEQILQDACEEVETSCASCGEFGSKLVTVDENWLRSTEAKLGVPIQMDKCSVQNGLYQLCGACFNALNRGKAPKFSAMNAVNVTMCQEYPSELQDLTLIEEYAVARSHPIGTVLKLKPNGMKNPTAHNGICGHIVTIPQNPGPLLDILPSPNLQFHDDIAIVWTGNKEPTVDDLKPFAEVRKDKVIRALLWLCEHNPLYKSVQINHELISQWEDSFIPRVLQEEIVHAPEDENSDERGTYAGDMEGLSENDLHNALEDMADGTIASGVVYSDVEGQRQNPDLKMVTALLKMINKPDQDTANLDAQEEDPTPVITWVGDQGRRVLMNDYEDSEFFTGAFPTLFPYGKGGHLPQANERRSPLSLETWGKWLMNHHSRRYARHPTFMFLLYDVIQRRGSALGNSLFVKRGEYKGIQEIMSSLTFDRLTAAAQSLRSTQKTSDPAIAVLRRALQTVAARVPNSFAEKQEMRLYLRGLFIEFGLAAFWLTINPSDLRDPLVIKLAGVVLPKDGLQKANDAFRRKTANMNPAAIAIFFDRLCTAILKGLVCPGEDKIGIFGEVSTYFGAVETNGRGMLHLHCLVWLAGNLDFFNLRRKMLNDPNFAGQMVDYLDSIISECINPHESEGKPEEMTLPFTSNFDTDEEYVGALHEYGNAVASKRQRHSKKHNPTCFKYCRQGARTCRFYFPRPKVEASHIDNLGVAHLRRDDEWVNPYNPWIAAAIGSNQDLSFLATRAKSLALMYYITNYATKDEASTYQMVMTAAMMRKTLEQAEKASDCSDVERMALEKGMRNFCLRVFNRMSHDKEVSGVKVMSSLLQLPGYYTPPTELRRINLYYLRRRFEALIQRSSDEEGTNEEQVAINLNRNFHASIFDDYRWRGSDLKDLCLYEYIKVIKKRAAEHRTGGDLDFDVQHPEHGKMTQVICGPESLPRTVTLLGTLSKYQQDEDSIRGGHPETLAMRNDLAGILLALFVPWETLPSLFDDVMSICGDECNAGCDQSCHTGLQACSIVWSRIANTLPEHVKDLARNVEILRKSKDDVDVDMAERKAAASAMQDTFNPEPEDTENMVDETTELNGSVDDDTLRLSYHLVRQRWAREDRITATDIAPLLQTWDEPPTLSVESFKPILVDSMSSIRQDVSANTLKLWLDLIKGVEAQNATSADNVDAASGVTQDMMDLDNDDNDNWEDYEDNDNGALDPVLTFTTPVDAGLDIAELKARLTQDPSPSNITSLITKMLPLNNKQKRTVSMIFYHVMRLQGKPVVENDDQFLLYVGGEGGTGKSRIIEAVRLGMQLMEREEEMLVMAPTGNAANHVQGSTIHTGLDVAVHGRKQGASQRVKGLWRNKIMLIIDEISMVSSKLMDSIDKQCKVVKNLDDKSTAVFGGVPVVIALGDFHQFSPVRANALWQKQQGHNEKRGQQLWHMFKNVMVLDEQMRQQQDVEFQQLLKHARNGSITQADVDVLNTRIISQLESRPDMTFIVRSNRLRHTLNRRQIEWFARSRGQKIFVFPARHTRRRKAKGSRDLYVDKLLEIQDRTDIKGPGLLLYTQDMPAMALSNISTRLGLVNGARGRAVSVIPDPNAKFYPIDSLYVLCTLPPQCILFEQDKSTGKAVFPGLRSSTSPIFCSPGRLKMENMSLIRHQVPLTPAWAVTEYKAQGSTYDIVVVDIHWPHRGARPSHKKYCSAYVQLSRARSLHGLFLLQPVTLEDFNGKPDKLLIDEDQRIAELASSTDAAWKKIETSPEFV